MPSAYSIREAVYRAGCICSSPRDAPLTQISTVSIRHLSHLLSGAPSTKATSTTISSHIINNKYRPTTPYTTTSPYTQPRLRPSRPSNMVFFIPVLLVIAGIAIYKEKKERKIEKRRSAVKVKGHGVVHYNQPAIDVKLHEEVLSESPPAYQQLDNSLLKAPLFAAATQARCAPASM
ncbi:hypothetical protein LTR53_013194 [Teratosphaeriaceae sp. CCFEE 6253]|nr:hypothetical protein LTR53_013194 [Teratosphaeriaceae sp. CCFEE 6253]